VYISGSFASKTLKNTHMSSHFQSITLAVTIMPLCVRWLRIVLRIPSQVFEDFLMSWHYPYQCFFRVSESGIRWVWRLWVWQRNPYQSKLPLHPLCTHFIFSCFSSLLHSTVYQRKIPFISLFITLTYVDLISIRESLFYSFFGFFMKIFWAFLKDENYHNFKFLWGHP
jgi:hypothetical protein